MRAATAIAADTLRAPRSARIYSAIKPGDGEGRRRYLSSTGSGGTLSFGAPACMVISVIETRS
jgi:hypothetical protein